MCAFTPVNQLVGLTGLYGQPDLVAQHARLLRGVRAPVGGCLRFRVR